MAPGQAVNEQDRRLVIAPRGRSRDLEHDAIAVGQQDLPTDGRRLAKRPRQRTQEGLQVWLAEEREGLEGLHSEECKEGSLNTEYQQQNINENGDAPCSRSLFCC